MHADTTPATAHDPIRHLVRQNLRGQLRVNGIVASISVVIATLGYASVKMALESLKWWRDIPVEIDDKVYKLGDLTTFVTANGTVPAIALIGFASTMALAFAALVQGCAGAAVARTHLGAGLTRREFYRMHVRASLSNTAIVTVFASAVLLLQTVAAGDLSGKLAFESGRTGNMWLVLLSTIAMAMLAYWGGFAISSLFVRFPWYVPAIGMLAYSIVSPVFGWLLGTTLFHTVIAFNRTILVETLSTAAWVAVAVVGSWFVIRRMPIRR